MSTYYALLGISASATAEEIEAAYQHQRERYSAERVAALGQEFERIAAERSAELERAWAVLTDPQRRQTYDSQIGAAVVRTPQPLAKKSGVSRRELLMAAGGALIGLLIIALVYAFSDNTTVTGTYPFAEVNREAPDFTLTNLDGQPVNLSDYRGQVVMLNFWWTGCEPCREETPALQAAYQQLQDRGFVILGVNVRAQERSGETGHEDIQRFVNAYGVTYPILLDDQSKVGRDYQVFVLPTTILIDQNGVERFKSFSAITTEDVERIVNQLQTETAALR